MLILKYVAILTKNIARLFVSCFPIFWSLAYIMLLILCPLHIFRQTRVVLEY